MGERFILFLLLSLYFYFNKINIFKILWITIIFKILFFLIDLLDFSNYIIFIYFIIYGSIFYGIYISIKSKSNKNIINLICNIILKFIYIYVFWGLLSDVYLFLDLPGYFNAILIPALFKLSFFEDSSVNPGNPANQVNPSPTGGSDGKGTPTEPKNTTGPTQPLEKINSTEYKVEIKNIISSENFNLAINKLFHAIGLQFSIYSSIMGTEYPIKWENLFYWLKTSSILSEEKIEKLSILLNSKDYNEFYKSIPRFFKWHENFLNFYYIFNGNIYLSEDMFDFYQGEPDKLKEDFKLDKSKFILVSETNANISNYKSNSVLTRFFNENLIPTINESEVQMINFPIKVGKITETPAVGEEDVATNINTKTKKYIFFMSISELFDSNNNLKFEINAKNKNLISNSDLDFENCKNFWQFDYFNKWFYYWFIELDINSFLSLNILGKLGIKLMDITPDKLMYAMHLAVVEYLEELDILMKAKIWYEHHTGIKYSSLSDSTLNEYKNLFLKFWVRQIIAYCKPWDLSENYYIPNMYDHSVVYLELLENIIYAQSKILEAQWTINTIYVYLPSFIESTEIEYDTKLINFYNKIFSLLKKEVINNYKDVYDLRRSYKINWYHADYPLSCEDLENNYKYINRVFKTDTPLDIELVSKLKKEK